MNRFLLFSFLFFGLLVGAHSQVKTNYTALLDAIPDFNPTTLDSMDQEWAVKNNVVPPIRESDAEFELRYFIHGEMYYQGMVLIIKGYANRFSVEKIGFAASKKAPNHWEKIKLLEEFTGPKDIFLWRFRSSLLPKNGWDNYISNIIQSQIFETSPPFSARIEIKKANSFKSIAPLTPDQESGRRITRVRDILSIPLEPEKPKRR